MRGQDVKARAERSIFEERSVIKRILSGSCNGFEQITRARGQNKWARAKRGVFHERSGVKPILSGDCEWFRADNADAWGANERARQTQNL